LEAFNALGGVGYLCAVAREDPKAFCALLGKLIPAKVAGDEENPLVLHATTATGPTNGRDNSYVVEGTLFTAGAGHELQELETSPGPSRPSD